MHKRKGDAEQMERASKVVVRTDEVRAEKEGLRHFTGSATETTGHLKDWAIVRKGEDV